jgi:glycosyltransferase involved in cell wall biosynthesis
VARSRLVIASKSAWDPPIRREHHLARLAAGRGHRVTFIERPVDIRGLRTDRRAWVQGLTPRRTVIRQVEIDLIQRSTVVPPHRNRIAEWVDGRLLGSRFRQLTDDAPPTVVAMDPWQWTAVSRLRSHRRIFDLGDDWSALMPKRAARVRDLYARAAEEADAIIVVSEVLRDLFPGREVTVVRNGVQNELLLTPRSEPPAARRLVYVGTLSERFDAPLLEQLLDRLPDYSLDVYGPCAYARRHGEPDAELARLLSREDGRARWYGPVARDSLCAALDGGDVLLLPNRAEQSRGQDSMKVYDYAARGRPVVATHAAAEGISELPPHLYLGADADELAALVLEAETEPVSWPEERAAWASAQSWDTRWPSWSSALFGATPDAVAGADRSPEVCATVAGSGVPAGSGPVHGSDGGFA